MWRKWTQKHFNRWMEKTVGIIMQPPQLVSPWDCCLSSLLLGSSSLNVKCEAGSVYSVFDGDLGVGVFVFLLFFFCFFFCFFFVCFGLVSLTPSQIFVSYLITYLYFLLCLSVFTLWLCCFTLWLCCFTLWLWGFCIFTLWICCFCSSR